MTLANAFDDDHDFAADGLADAVQRLGVRLRYAKDAEVYAQEDEAEFVYLVVSGAARTSRLTADGRRQIAEFYYPGELFGLEPGPEHRFSAEALCDCEVLALRRSALKAVTDDGALERVIWRATRRELERAQEHLMLLGRKTACERVASFLAGVAGRGRAPAVDLVMSRQDMADYLGLTIETVSRMLSQLQSRKVVEFAGSRQFRVSNPDALARLAA